MLPAKAGFKLKPKIPDFERGKTNILITPYDLPDLRVRHEYIEYIEDKAKASLRAKFEPVNKPHSSGTQRLDKRKRFEKVSILMTPGHYIEYT